MTDQDIVTRLRGHIAITTRIHYAKDGYPEPVYVHGPSPICQEAADEIERLRKRLLAEENAYDIERNQNDHLQTDRNNLVLEVERLRAERDEARREICRNEADEISMELGGAAIFASAIAKRRGWDCFKEAP
jgi:hypothetical protein